MSCKIHSIDAVRPNSLILHKCATNHSCAKNYCISLRKIDWNAYLNVARCQYSVINSLESIQSEFDRYIIGRHVHWATVHWAQILFICRLLWEWARNFDNATAQHWIPRRLTLSHVLYQSNRIQSVQWIHFFFLLSISFRCRSVEFRYYCAKL